MKLHELKFRPIGTMHPTPRQIKDLYIRRLEQVVVSLSALCIGLAVMICMLAAGVVI